VNCPRLTTDMRVLHVSSGNLFGGIETMLLTLARNRNQRPGDETEIALCYAGRLGEELEKIGCLAHQLPTPRASRPHTVLRARHALAAFLATRNFDCVICHSQWTQGIFGPTVRRAGLPLVMWVHGPLTGRHWSELWAGQTSPDLVICTSDFTAQTVPYLYQEVPVEVIHPPVDMDLPTLSAGERSRVREELSTAEDAVVIIQPSRVEAWKGHAALVDALGQLRDLPNWIWWQVGGVQRSFEAAYLESIRERARTLEIVERVRFTGERSDVRRLLSAADIHCQANLHPEPFGIAFVEALSAGLPVVTIALGGALEIVDDSCGLLVPPGDSGALAGALRRLITEPGLRTRLSAAAPARARRVSDPTRQIRRLQTALERLVKEKGREGQEGRRRLQHRVDGRERRAGWR
jgi:glycosyltransferase involved in cell wall biosynthesis